LYAGTGRRFSWVKQFLQVGSDGIIAGIIPEFLPFLDHTVYGAIRVFFNKVRQRCCPQSTFVLDLNCHYELICLHELPSYSAEF